MNQFLKYTAIFVGVQLLACIALWLSAIALSSDVLFGMMIYFYWPLILALAALSGARGESAMIAVPVYGAALGILTYAIIGGIITSYIKRRRRTQR
jgi:hypothetical protein